MDTELNIQSCILQLQEACGPDSQNDPGLKWELLRKLSPRFLREKDYSKSDYREGYSTILTVLLEILSPTLFKHKEEEHLFCEFFLDGLNHFSFIVLAQHLSTSSPSFSQQKIIELLEKFIDNGNIYLMIHDECCNSDAEVVRTVNQRSYWDLLLTCLVSLPERVANKTKREAKKIFSIYTYVPFMVSVMWKVLCAVHKNLTEERDCNVLFLGKLVGRFCSAGHSAIIVKSFCSYFLKVCGSDFIWRRIAQNLISKIPAINLESFLIHALQEVPWYKCLEWIFGDVVLTNKKMRYLMMVKFLMIRQVKNDLILQNMIGYLASSATRKCFFDEVFNTLLDAWCNESAFKHQSFDQQYYIACAIMCCIAHMKADSNAFKKKDARSSKALQGVQLRIGNSDPLVRNIGMVVGANLIALLNPESPKPNFEIDIEFPEIQRLYDLMCIPKEPDVLCEDGMFLLEELDHKEEHEKDDDSHCYHLSSPFKSKELDSDDDLEPYDMSDDVECEKKNRPFYLRDCLQGLIEAEKPEWAEQCLRCAPELINNNPDEASEVAVELAKVLLHLNDSFAMTDFIPCRHKALMTITMQCPSKVAAYLTSQFYERDYNIRQRLDILEVIAAVSQALSQPNYQHQPPETPKKLPSMKQAEENWQQVIERRLEARTRRLSIGPRKRPEPHLNLFGPVAGLFFFPLLEKFDKESRMLNLMGDDSYVLGRLLYTLGIVMYSSSNLPICRQMGSSLLKFVAVIRNHCDTFVRKGAIFATTMVFLAVPAYLLLFELQHEVMSSQAWLNELVENDREVECQVRAAQAVRLLQKSVEDFGEIWIGNSLD